jgi:hypothetical protein
MDACEVRSSCFFFNAAHQGTPGLAGQLRDMYCTGNYAACARLLVYRRRGRNKVPDYLSPDDIQEACKLLDDLS